jgi:enoyl-CoA hydratase/carnithine racemase
MIELSSSREDILVAIDANGVAIVTLNRPAKRNAVSLAMWRGLKTIFDDLARQSQVRAVILTGAGGNFCAGADISEFPQVRATVEDGRVYEAAGEAATLAIRDFPRPTIAAISGYGVGGGCGLALCCDFRVADATAFMGIPAARLGIIYGVLDCQLLYRQVGLANAKRVLFSGRYFGIADCVRMGLVDIEANGGALAAAKVFAEELTSGAPLSQEGAKVVLEAIDAGTTEEREAVILALLDRAIDSDDYREGGRAFLEKRKPKFTGH